MQSSAIHKSAAHIVQYIAIITIRELIKLG